jgi:hypothetical protein
MNMKNVFAATLVAGLIASSAAMAQETKEVKKETTVKEVTKDAHSCDGKDANSCKGKKKHHSSKKKVETKTEEKTE